MFKPLVQPRTREKVRVMGSDFLTTLRESIAHEEIPEEYGGGYRDVPWVSE